MARHPTAQPHGATTTTIKKKEEPLNPVPDVDANAHVHTSPWRTLSEGRLYYPRLELWYSPIITFVPLTLLDYFPAPKYVTTMLAGNSNPEKRKSQKVFLCWLFAASAAQSPCSVFQFWMLYSFSTSVDKVDKCSNSTYVSKIEIALS